MGTWTVTDSGITLTGASAGNYTVNASATTTAGITPLSISGSITASNKTYDGGTTVTIATKTLTGVLTGDVGSVNLFGGTASFASADVANGITVTDTGLSLTGTLSGDYSLSNATETTTANITPLAISGSIAAGNKTYDGGTSASITSAEDLDRRACRATSSSVRPHRRHAQLCRCERGQWHYGDRHRLELERCKSGRLFALECCRNDHGEHHAAGDHRQHHCQQQDL